MSKPNIIFILIDDMGWRDLVCTGSDFYETPNIDRLAKEGMLFTDAYAASPVCSPTRASLMSGKYPARMGVTSVINHSRPADSPYGNHRGKLYDAPYVDHLPETEFSLARALNEGGYQTWHIGKWHLGQEPWYPNNHGFHVNIGGCEMGAPGRDGYFAPWPHHTLLKNADCPDGTYLTDYLTDRTLELLENRDREKPFFLNLWYYQVHIPLQAKVEKIRKYEEKARELGLADKNPLVEGDYFPAEHLKDRRIQRRTFQSHPVYAAMIESLDENVGRLLEWLDDTEDPREPGRTLSETTLVMFTSDNGGLSSAEGSPTCNLPLAEGKGWRYEGGVREPLLVRWPHTVDGGSKCSVPLISPDFYPTLLDAAGLPLRPEQHVDGLSFLPLLKGGEKLERESLFWHFPHYGNQGNVPGAAMRKGKWKLLLNFEPVEDDSEIKGSALRESHIELYDLEADPGETLEVSPSHPALADELLGELKAWLSETGAVMPKPNPAFDPWSEEHRNKGYRPLD